MKLARLALFLPLMGSGCAEETEKPTSSIDYLRGVFYGTAPYREAFEGDDGGSHYRHGSHTRYGYVERGTGNKVTLYDARSDTTLDRIRIVSPSGEVLHDEQVGPTGACPYSGRFEELLALRARDPSAFLWEGQEWRDFFGPEW